MKQISLTQGQFATVDDRDHEWLSVWKWFAHWDRCTRSYYAARNLSSRSTTGRRQVTIKMARVILCAQPGQFVDHINHQTLDNQRINLRLCSPSENKRNRQKQSNNTSGFIGVSWYTSYNVWVAHINLNGKKLHLGYFTNKDEAALARDDAVKRLYGEFGVLNFIYKPLSELTDGLPPISEL
jgi:hypothetical protein